MTKEEWEDACGDDGGDGAHTSGDDIGDGIWEDPRRPLYTRWAFQDYSFWYILLTAKSKRDMFWIRFEKKLVVA